MSLFCVFETWGKFIGQWAFIGATLSNKSAVVAPASELGVKGERENWVGAKKVKKMC